MLNLALVGDKDGDLYPEDDASSEKDIISLRRKGGDSDDDDDDDDDEDDELNTDEESSVGGMDPAVPSTSTRGVKEQRSSGTSLKGCLKSRPCTICVYLCLALLILASVVSLIVVGVLVVAPFRKAMDFQETLCVATRTLEEGEDRRCSCGKGCNSKYSCIEIKVALPVNRVVRVAPVGGRQEDTDTSTDKEDKGQTEEKKKERKKIKEVVMYDNEATLAREVSLQPIDDIHLSVYIHSSYHGNPLISSHQCIQYNVQEAVLFISDNLGFTLG